MKSRSLSIGHTTVKAPYPIRTAKLSTVGPDQYYGRGLRGNLRCCKALFYFLRCVQLLVFVHACDAPGVLAQSEACVLSKHEVLGSKPRYSKCIRYGVVGNISACHADARGSIPRFGVACARGLVGYDACFTRRRSPVQVWACVFCKCILLKARSCEPAFVCDAPVVQ